MGGVLSPYLWPHETRRAFFDAWGHFPEDLNGDGLPWEHVDGMAVAAGL